VAYKAHPGFSGVKGSGQEAVFRWGLWEGMGDRKEGTQIRK
jgi:hypothetical protein